MSTPALTGSCGCGAVRFEIAEPLVAAAYCHCGRCQKRTGTAAQASAKVAPGSVSVLAGEEHLRDWSPPGGSTRPSASSADPTSSPVSPAAARS